jgi:hypothetical protein
MTVSITRTPAAFQRPFCDVTTASQSPANTTTTTADLPASATVDNGAAVTGTALLDGTNDRVYLRRAGLWQVHAVTNWAANGTGKRTLSIVNNSGTTIAQNTNDNFSGFFGCTHSASALVYTSVTTDYVQAKLYQSSGGALATTTTVRAVWLGAYL